MDYCTMRKLKYQMAALSTKYTLKAIYFDKRRQTVHITNSYKKKKKHFAIFCTQE